MYGNHRFRTEEKGNSLKWSRKSIIFSPFSYRASCFPENISRHANKVSLFHFKKKRRKRRNRKESGRQKKFSAERNCTVGCKKDSQDVQMPFLNQILFPHAHSKFYCYTARFVYIFSKFQSSLLKICSS